MASWRASTSGSVGDGGAVAVCKTIRIRAASLVTSTRSPTVATAKPEPLSWISVTAMPSTSCVSPFFASRLATKRITFNAARRRNRPCEKVPRAAQPAGTGDPEVLSLIGSEISKVNGASWSSRACLCGNGIASKTVPRRRLRRVASLISLKRANNAVRPVSFGFRSRHQ